MASAAFANQMVKWQGGQYVESAVYNVATGEKLICWPVDARELVATGEFSYEPQTAAVSQVEEPASDVAPARRRGAKP